MSPQPRTTFGESSRDERFQSKPAGLPPWNEQKKRSLPACALQSGVDIEAVGARYGVDAWGRFGPGLAPFIAEGMVLREGTRIRLSREGMLVANEIMAVFV